MINQFSNILIYCSLNCLLFSYFFSSSSSSFLVDFAFTFVEMPCMYFVYLLASNRMRERVFKGKTLLFDPEDRMKRMPGRFTRPNLQFI